MFDDDDSLAARTLTALGLTPDSVADKLAEILVTGSADENVDNTDDDAASPVGPSEPRDQSAERDDEDGD